MKIAHIVFGMGLGGIETMLVNIVNEQIKQDTRINIIIINDIVDDDLISTIDKHIIVTKINRKIGSKSPIPLLKINLELLMFNPDIIHLHFASIYNFIAIPLFKKKLCVTLHSMCLPESSKSLHKFKHIFAISKTVQEDIKKQLNKDSILVYNGIIPSKISICANNKQKDTYRIIQVGRLLHQVKGQHILIHALAELDKMGINNIKIDFIGDGPSKDFLISLTNDLHLNNKVAFLGSQTQSFINMYLCKYDLLVQPSIHEGFGLTIIEAMAAKIPVLVSNGHGADEIINYGKFGFNFINGDSYDCASKIKIIMESSDNTDFLNNAWEWVNTSFDVKNTALSYINQYKRIIQTNYKK